MANEFRFILPCCDLEKHITDKNAFPSPFDSAPYEALSPNRKYFMWGYCFEEKKTSSFHLRLLFLIFFQKRWAAYIEQTQFLH